MASSGKKKTTMAKLSRESKLRERRQDKQARKDARKNAPAPADQPEEMPDAMAVEGDRTDAGHPAHEALLEPSASLPGAA